MNAQQLRNSILQMAIQGKLVPQDPNDEPAGVLLERINKTKCVLLKEKSIRKCETLIVPVEEDEMFIELPQGWCWSRLGEIAAYRKGPFGSSLTKSMFVPKSPTSYKVYEQKNAIQKDVNLGEYYISQEKYDSMQSFMVSPGDIIVSCAGTIGETYLIPDGAPKGIINQALMRVKLYDSALVPYWMLFFEYVVIYNSTLKGKGSAIKNIPPFEILKNLPIPLPPLAEQRRIVAKLEELLPLVEQYGKAQDNLDALNNDLPRRLRQSILQEAIQGKLVPQDPNDDWSKEYVASLPRKKYKSSSEWPNERPFELPCGWNWCHIGDLCEISNGYAFKSSNYVNSGIRVMRISNVQDGIITDKDPKYYPLSTQNEIEDYMLKDGDLLMSLTGNVGRVGILSKDFLPAALNQRVACLRLKDECIKDFFFLYLQSDIFKQRSESSGHGMAQLNISTEWLKQEYFPLPPLAEQHRIVAKIEQLFTEIDKLV